MDDMKSKLLSLRQTLLESIQKFLLSFGVIVVISGLIVQITMVGLELAGQTEITNNIAHWFSWKFDGTFKNNPNNVWYNEEEHIWVESVENQVKIGKLAGNRNLSFGVKNILEEFLQEKGYDLSKDAPYKLSVQIVYLDVLTTKKNVSVFHKNEEEVVIRMKGILTKDGKKEKEILVEESSSEISMSTLIVDEGGKFNQTSLSNAIKKACDKLITKLTEK